MDKEELNLNELLEDIRRIKSAIRQNSSAFKEMVYLPVLKLIFLIGGITALVIPLAYYFLLKYYGRYEAIPFEIRLLLVAGIITGFVLTGSGKLIIINSPLTALTWTSAIFGVGMLTFYFYLLVGMRHEV